MTDPDFDTLDDVLKEATLIPIDCPVCGKEFELNIYRDSDVVTCPHCKAKIEIDSK